MVQGQKGKQNNILDTLHNLVVKLCTKIDYFFLLLFSLGSNGGQPDEKKVMEYGFDAIFMGDNKSEK